MKFDREALLEAVDKALVASGESHEAAELERALSFAQAQSEWIEQWRDTWRAAIRKMQSKMTRGFPITPSDLPTDRHGQTAVFVSWSGNHRQTDGIVPNPYRAPQDLVALREILPTISDRYVTSAGLRELGITGTAVRRVLVHMAQASATTEEQK